MVKSYQGPPGVFSVSGSGSSTRGGKRRPAKAKRASGSGPEKRYANRSSETNKAISYMGVAKARRKAK